MNNKILKKLNTLVDKKRSEILDSIELNVRHGIEDGGPTFDPKMYREAMRLEAAKLNPRTILALTYGIKSGCFTNYKASCYFNPETGYGTSYGWYALTLRIKGHLVLNTYSYSNQTAKHVRKVCSVLNKLGMKFITVQAPKGLQSLDVAKSYALESYGAAIIRQRFARKPHKVKERDYFHNLELIGVKFSAKEKTQAVKDAEKRRLERLANKREDVKREKERIKALELMPNVFIRVNEDVRNALNLSEDAWHVAVRKEDVELIEHLLGWRTPSLGDSTNEQAVKV